MLMLWLSSLTLPFVGVIVVAPSTMAEVEDNAELSGFFDHADLGEFGGFEGHGEPDLEALAKHLGSINEQAQRPAFGEMPSFGGRRESHQSAEQAELATDARRLKGLPTASVFKVYVTGATRSYLLPWQVQTQKHWSGSGFAVTDRLIMTNAHVAQNNQFVEVTKQDGAQRFEARVLVIAHDIDLALLTVDNEAFWENVEPYGFSQTLPRLYSEVTAVGYPVGGSTVSVTKGVVSRIDAHVYVHPEMSGIMQGSTNNPGPLLIVQIDAAINPGNSGGPAFTDSGEVCGVASSGMPNAQNVGYIIPASVVLNFISEYKTSKSWGGLPEAGIVTRSLENKALRRFLMPPDMAEGNGGVQVQSVSPLSPLRDHLSAGDVLLEIDGETISKEATVRFNISGSSMGIQLPFRALITVKPKGATTTFTVLRRSGGTEKVSVEFGPLPSMAPRFDGIDAKPSYVIVGGLVFTHFSTPLFNQASQGSGGLAALMGGGPALSIPQSVLSEAMFRWRTAGVGDSGLVVLLRVLKHSVNAGYDLDAVRILRRVNGKNVTGLASLIQNLCTVRAAGERFLYFSFAEDDVEVPSETPEDPDVVLETEAIAAADVDILMANGIHHQVSKDLSTMYTETCAQGVQDTQPVSAGGEGSRHSHNPSASEL